MTATVEFFFDLSSPWTRIAFHNCRNWSQGRDIAIIWRPFLVGGVFNAVNDSVYAGRQNPDNPKLRLSFLWLKEWASLAGVTMNFPSTHHPVRSVQAMRFCCALEQDQAQLVRFAEAAFEAYFADQQNLDDPEVLVEIANGCGLDGKRLAILASDEPIKNRLRASTQEAIDRGAFGSPTLYVDGRFQYFGNDQLPLVYHRIGQPMGANGSSQ